MDNIKGKGKLVYIQNVAVATSVDVNLLNFVISVYYNISPLLPRLL